MTRLIRTASPRALFAVLAVALASEGLVAQTYYRGQNVSPAYEGWERNPDGSYSLLFGYMNRNWQEELDVPIGPDNNIEPGEPDQGQPTHFLPRRNRFVFRVRVPADWGDKELIWTLTTKGKTERAYATLRTDYFVDDIVKASEMGALGAGTSNPEIRANKAPSLKVEGESARTIRAGQPLTLSAVATDDGVPPSRRERAEAAQRRRLLQRATPEETAAAQPRNPAYVPPRQSTVGSETGLRLSWFVYRGAGRVTFTPEQIKVWEDTRAGQNSPWAELWRTPPAPPDGRWVVQATFEHPGTYVIRCLASDGALNVEEDVTVTVTP